MVSYQENIELARKKGNENMICVKYGMLFST